MGARAAPAANPTPAREAAPQIPERGDPGAADEDGAATEDEDDDASLGEVEPAPSVVDLADRMADLER
ncbi:MAG TPA: hypothetical protein VIU64_22205, partial [Polyangia bacterium]